MYPGSTERTEKADGKVGSVLPAAVVELLLMAEVLFAAGDKFNAAIFVNAIYTVSDAINVQQSLACKLGVKPDEKCGIM